MIEKLKNLYALHQLRKDASQVERQRKDPDIHKNASIGILYDATDKDTFEMVKEFFRDLRSNGKTPVSLGYIDYKETTFHPLARPESDYFFKHQLNWLQKPSGAVVENFTREPFDILINLTLSDFLPLDYIAATSKAGLKIGRNNSAIAACYDLTFSLDENADLKAFAYTIIHYLSQINHERNQSAQRNRSSHYYTV
jgi:hypothetical protein